MAIDTSAAYKTAIKADTELTRFEAQFTFIPPGAVENSAVSSTSAASLGRVEQINDGVENPSFFKSEFGSWLLNGTRKVIDASDAAAQIGYISGGIGDSAGAYSGTKPNVIYTFDTAYDIIGVTLFFDSVAQEWATSVTVQYYNASNALITEQTFTNNGAVMAVELTGASVKWVKAIINTWNVPVVHAKICEMLPGEIFVFSPDNVFSFKFSEHVKPFKTNIELPEFTIAFDNAEKKFDVVNPSGLMSYLRQLMQIFSKIGILESSVYEYVKTGEFYLYDWPDTSQQDTAQVICKPLLAFKDNIFYVAPGTGTQTVATAAGVIFGLAGISNYTVDASLQSISVNQYIGENVPLPSAVGQLAVAAGGYWKIGRDGSYNLLPYSFPASSNDTDYNNMWESPDIEQKKKVTSVNVKYYTFSVDRLAENNNIVTAVTDDGTRADDICSCFIPSSARANAVGVLALQYYALRIAYGVKYRGDMSIEAGDVITVENDFAERDIFVTDHVLTWDADKKLDGEIKGMGAA